MLGGFTTYSLLATQLAEQLLAGAVWLAAGYAVTTIGGGLVASAAGVWLAHILRRRSGGES
ncbi:hypothetical protein FM113_14295 [Leucobacter sp. 7(1)]|nr:hypothetical protein FM113_14295 [Leucobacter sp. 7(1)]